MPATRSKKRAEPAGWAQLDSLLEEDAARVDPPPASPPRMRSKGRMGESPDTKKPKHMGRGCRTKRRSAKVSHHTAHTCTHSRTRIFPCDPCCVFGVRCLFVAAGHCAALSLTLCSQATSNDVHPRPASKKRSNKVLSTVPPLCLQCRLCAYCAPSVLTVPPPCLQCSLCAYSVPSVLTVLRLMCSLFLPKADGVVSILIKALLKCCRVRLL